MEMFLHGTFTWSDDTAKLGRSVSSKHDAYNKKLGEDDITEVDVGEGVGQRRRTQSRDERMQSRVTVDDIGVVVSRQQRQQTHHIWHIRLPGD